jgi:hypothetical protein
MTTEIPPTMFAWRKHMGNQTAIWEEVPVPTAPADGFLVKIIASGGTSLLRPRTCPHLSAMMNTDEGDE